MHALRRFLDDEGGADGIEYGILIALIFLAILVGVSSMASNTVSMWTHVSSHVK